MRILPPILLAAVLCLGAASAAADAPAPEAPHAARSATRAPQVRPSPVPLRKAALRVSKMLGFPTQLVITGPPRLPAHLSPGARVPLGVWLRIGVRF